MIVLFKYILLYFSTLIIFFIVDMIWLGVIAKKFYRDQLGALLLDNFKWAPAFIFYFMFICGLLIFVVIPSLEKKSLLYAVSFGAMFGLIAYATYDLTNLATLKGWPIHLTIVDMIWGAVLSAIVSSFSYLVAKIIFTVK